MTSLKSDVDTAGNLGLSLQKVQSSMNSYNAINMSFAPSMFSEIVMIIYRSCPLQNPPQNTPSASRVFDVNYSKDKPPRFSLSARDLEKVRDVSDANRILDIENSDERGRWSSTVEDFPCPV